MRDSIDISKFSFLDFTSNTFVLKIFFNFSNKKQFKKPGDKIDQNIIKNQQFRVHK